MVDLKLHGTIEYGTLSLSLQSLAGAQPFDRDTLRVGEKVYH